MPRSAAPQMHTEEEFRIVFDYLQEKYNVGDDHAVFLCAHHYQNVHACANKDLAYFGLNRWLRIFSIPHFVQRELVYFDYAKAA